MRIVFIQHRTSLYRHFAPLMQEGLRRGYVIECWHDYSEKRGGTRWYNFPDLEHIPDFGESNNKLIIKQSYNGKEELAGLLSKRNDIDFVISVHLPLYHLSDPSILCLASFKWITVMSSLDNYPEFFKIKEDNADYLKKVIFFPHSNTWLKILEDYLRRFKPDNLFIFDKKYLVYEIVGNPEFDSFKDIDPDRVREKYGIPKGKFILLYLPFCYGNRSNSGWEMAFAGISMNTFMKEDGELVHDRKQPFLKNVSNKLYCLRRIFKDPLATKYFVSMLNEARVFQAVRRFCDRNNLYLVVKPRLKYPVSEVVKLKADLVVWDAERQLVPPVLKELLSVSKLAIAFCSYSVLTAVFGKVFHLNVTLPDEFFVDDVHRFWYSPRAPSLFNFPGVCDSWDIKKVINELDKTPLEQLSINPAERRNYVERYAGFDDYASSMRFFDALEKYRVQNLAVQNYGK